MEAVDRALAALLRRDVLGEAVEVSLEAPNRPWSQGVTKPTINLFLFDVRENLARREVMVEPVRDASGAVVARRPPPARYDLFYILSCWGTPVELEHQILSAVIASLGSYDKLPEDLFGPDAPPHGCFLSTVAGMKRGMLPMFGGELRMQLDLAVTVPLMAPSVAVAGPPVREPARIQVNGRSPEEIADVRRRTARLPSPRVPNADPFAPTRAAIAAAVEAMPPRQATAAGRTARQAAATRPAPARRTRPATARAPPQPAAPARRAACGSAPARRAAGRCSAAWSAPARSATGRRTAARSASGRRAARGCREPAPAAPGRAGPGRAGAVRARPGRRRALHPAARTGTRTGTAAGGRTCTCARGTGGPAPAQAPAKPAKDAKPAD